MNKSWLVLLIIVVLLSGSCSVLAGGVDHWPATAIAVALMIPLKILNDRMKWLAWPMEFLLIGAILMIVSNLGRLYVTPLPY